jgi:hypothetical protein
MDACLYMLVLVLPRDSMILWMHASYSSCPHYYVMVIHRSHYVAICRILLLFPLALYLRFDSVCNLDLFGVRVNPIKVFLHVFPAVQPWQIAAGAAAFMLYIFISDVKNLLYFFLAIFFHSILSIFFRSVEVVGR